MEKYGKKQANKPKI